MNDNQARAVAIVADAIAADSGWEKDTADYDQAVDMAIVAVAALAAEGLLLNVD